MYYYKNFINKVPEEKYLQFIINNYYSDNYRLDYSIKDLQNYTKNCISSHSCFCINNKEEVVGSIIITKYSYLDNCVNYINFACTHFDYRKQNIILDILKEISRYYSKYDTSNILSLSDYVSNAERILGNILFSTQIKIPNIPEFSKFNFVYTSFTPTKESTIKEIKEVNFLNKNYIKYVYSSFDKYFFLEVNNIEVVCYTLDFINKFNEKKKNVYIIDSSELLSENEIQKITHYFKVKNIDCITFLNILFEKNIKLENTVESKPNYIYTNVKKLNNLIIF